MILLHDLMGAKQLDCSKDMSMLVSSFTSYAWFQHINASCVEILTVIRCMFLYLVTKMSDWFLEQQINIKFFVNLRRNVGDICAVLSEAYGGKLWKNQVFLGGINSLKRACMPESHMEITLSTFFNVKGIVHF